MFQSLSLIDLTHPLTDKCPTWNGSCGFHVEIKKDYDKMFRVQQIKMHAGCGTHIDAPSHCIPKGISAGEISLSELIVPVAVIDVSTHAHQDYEITIEDIDAYEKKYGIIPKNALVIGYTGWDRFWADKAAYRNPDSNGHMHFPAFSKAAASVLLTRNIAGLAIDTLSPDCSDKAFPVHQLILGAGKYIIENVANARKLPPQGANAIALPLAAALTESPIRLIGVY